MCCLSFFYLSLGSKHNPGKLMLKIHQINIKTSIKKIKDSLKSRFIKELVYKQAYKMVE